MRTVSSELGVSHLSVSAVTKRAGCTRSLFYHYFADMDAAVTAVMDEAIDGFISELEQWNANRTVGDIEGALDTVAPLFKRLVVSGHELPSTLTSSHHELRIDHVYETFYTLIMGLLMYIRTHPDVPDETVKEIIASTLHIEGYTAKYPERKPQN